MAPAVVIIENDLAQAHLVRDILTHPTNNTAVILGVFTSGRRFFEWLDSGIDHSIIDLVILDMRLPGEHGYELLPKLRNRLGVITRVVALTANVMPSDVQRAQLAGFDGFIGKPLDPDLLPGYIEDVLRGERIWKPL